MPFGFEEKKKEEEKKQGRRPDVRGFLPVVAWFEKNEKGEEYLNVKLLGGYVRLYPNNEDAEKK